jgi:hypothetical protein
MVATTISVRQVELGLLSSTTLTGMASQGLSGTCLTIGRRTAVALARWANSPETRFHTLGATAAAATVAAGSSPFLFVT